MKRKTFLFGLSVLLLFLISLSFSRTHVVLADHPIPPSPPTEDLVSPTPSPSATPTPTITPTYTSTPTVTHTSTATFTATATYDASTLYPVQDDTLDTQAQLRNIRDAIAKLQGYVETSQPDNSRIQDALDAIKDALRTAEQEAEIDGLNQKIIGWIQFAAGLVLGALLGWVNIDPPLPPIKRDVIANKMRHFAKIAKVKLSRKPFDKKVEQPTATINSKNEAD